MPSQARTRNSSPGCKVKCRTSGRAVTICSNEPEKVQKVSSICDTRNNQLHISSTVAAKCHLLLRPQFGIAFVLQVS
jgi:hypothetical protein